MKNGALIPLSDVADDARDLVKAFRDNGEISSQDLTLEEARENYRISCAASQIKVNAKLVVTDFECPVSGGTIRLRHYSKGDDTPRPLLLYLHGGGWVIGDLDTHDGICRYMAKKTSANVVAVDYRLSPEYTFPVPYQDCVEALHWLSKNQSALKLDCSRTIVMGDSAGGNMATVLANEKNIPENVEIICQILLYPVTDLTASSASYKKITQGFSLTDKTMYWFRQNYVPKEIDLRDRRLSPLFHNHVKQPTMFIVTVGLDPLVDEGCDYANVAAKSGTELEHHHLPQHMHGMFTSAGKIKTAKKLLKRAAHFIEERFSS